MAGKTDNYCAIEPCVQANQAADVAVAKVFAILGVDVSDPESVEEFREDLRFGKKLRKAADKGAMAAVGVIATSITTALIYGLANTLTGKP